MHLQFTQYSFFFFFKEANNVFIISQNNPFKHNVGLGGVSSKVKVINFQFLLANDIIPTISD